MSDAEHPPTKTYVDADGLYIPSDLRDVDTQVVFRTPRVTIQKFVKHDSGLDPYMGVIDESHFGDEDELGSVQNPQLVPDQVSIKHAGEDAIVLDVEVTDGR